MIENWWIPRKSYENSGIAYFLEINQTPSPLLNYSMMNILKEQQHQGLHHKATSDTSEQH